MLSFINIRYHIRIISMAAVIHCGRLCGALRNMINGSWVEERLQIDIVWKGVIRNGSVFFHVWCIFENNLLYKLKIHLCPSIISCFAVKLNNTLRVYRGVQDEIIIFKYSAIRNRG